MPRTLRDNYQGYNFNELLRTCLEKIGKRFDRCEYCNRSGVRLTLHHTVYDGATLYDIDVICYKCNLAEENKRLK